ncbi:MAG: hypothetical protein ABJ295_11545, partial [Marinomonas sp.]
MTADAELRAAAERGEDTPVSAMGWLRITLRGLALIAALIVLVPLHYIFRIISYGSPFPMWFLRFATRVVGAKVETVGVPLK